MTTYRVTNKEDNVCYEVEADYIRYSSDGSARLCNRRWWWFTDKVVATTLATDTAVAVHQGPGESRGEVRFP